MLTFQNCLIHCFLAFFSLPSIPTPSTIDLDAELTVFSIYKYITQLQNCAFFSLLFCSVQAEEGTSGGKQETETIKTTQGTNINSNILNKN